MGLHAFRGISLQESNLSPFHLPVDHHGDQMCRWFVQLPHFKDWCQPQDTRSWYLKRRFTGIPAVITITIAWQQQTQEKFTTMTIATMCKSLKCTQDARFLNRWWFLVCEMIPQIWVWLGSVCSSANEIELNLMIHSKGICSAVCDDFFHSSETWVGNHVETVGYGWIWMDMDGYGWIWMDREVS